MKDGHSKFVNQCKRHIRIWPASQSRSRTQTWGHTAGRRRETRWCRSYRWIWRCLEVHRGSHLRCSPPRWSGRSRQIFHQHWNEMLQGLGIDLRPLRIYFEQTWFCRGSSTYSFVADYLKLPWHEYFSYTISLRLMCVIIQAMGFYNYGLWNIHKSQESHLDCRRNHGIGCLITLNTFSMSLLVALNTIASVYLLL